MVLLGALPNHRTAKALSDYLQLRKIANEIQPVTVETLSNPDAYGVFVGEQDQATAIEIFHEFAENPNHEKFREASWLVGQVDSSVAQPYNKPIQWTKTGPFTKIVTFVCALVFLLSYMGMFGAINGALSFQWSWSEPYRLITPAIMHLSLLHIAFNLSWWWFFAGRIERLLGSGSLVAIFIISALVSNIAQATIVHSGFAGLSGVNFALAGFAWYCGAIHKSQSLFLPNNMFVFVIAWMLLGFAEILPISMANWAHLLGLLSGMALAHVMIKKAA